MTHILAKGFRWGIQHIAKYFLYTWIDRHTDLFNCKDSYANKFECPNIRLITVNPYLTHPVYMDSGLKELINV